MPLNRNR